MELDVFTACPKAAQKEIARLYESEKALKREIVSLKREVETYRKVWQTSLDMTRVHLEASNG